MDQPSCFGVFSGRPGIHATIAAARRSLATLLICLTASTAWAAEDQQFKQFIDNLPTFTSGVDRPVLMVSRGTAIAWIPNPLALPKNFSNYMSNDYSALIPVPVGTAMMAFPPRDPKKTCTYFSFGCAPAPGADRGMSPNYVLVLTADGLWGVLDKGHAVGFLDESDLKPIAQYQQNKPSSKFALTTAQINVDISGDGSRQVSYFPPGQLLRVSDDSNDSKTVVDIGGDDADLKVIPALKNIQQQFNKSVKQGTPLRDKFEVSKENLTYLTIFENIVPQNAVEDWVNGKVGEYYKTILQGGAFFMVWAPSDPSTNPSIIGCDKEQVTKSSWEGKVDSSIKAGAKGSIGLLGNTAELETKATAQLAAAQSDSTTQTMKSAILQRLFPVEIVDKDGKEHAFWAGTARNCSGAPTWTLMVDNTPPSVEPNAEYLHPNFDRIAKELSSKKSEEDGKRQLAAIRDDLGKITPGGNPFDFETGVVKFKCLSQAIAFAQIARDKMASAPAAQVNAVIALATSKIPRSGNAMKTFAADSACKR